MSRTAATLNKLFGLSLIFGLLAAACTPQGAAGLGQLDGTIQTESTAQSNTNSSDTPLTSELQAAADDAEVEFAGLVTSIGASEWIIGAQTVQVTAQTEIEAGVALGAFVRVHARPGADGSLVAREVELAAGQAGDDDEDDGDDNGADDDDDNLAGEQEFIGVLSAIDGDLWTIGGQQVRVTTSAEVKANLQIGDLVKVHASLGSDGVLLAREVELADEDDLNDDNGDDDGDNADNSGPGNGDDDGDNDDNSGAGNGDDDGDNDDNSGSGNGDNDGDNDDNSGGGGGDD